MIKLQNDFTTPEQSKRLLELGVPADSANYAYMCYETGDMCRVFINHPYTIYSEDVKRLLDRKTLPCWSVGRLIEIIGICHQPIPTEMRIATSNIIEYLLDIFDTIADGSGFDFSKLEE